MMTKSPLITKRRAPYLCTVEADFRERNAPGPNLHLTTRFSDDVLSLGPIQIRVALARAYLNFRLENCAFPLACNLEQTWSLSGKAKATLKKRLSRTESETDQIGLTASSLPSAKLNSSSRKGTSSAEETKLENTTTWQHVFWRGDADGPSLVFDSRPSQKYLSGTLLSGELVGSVAPKQSNYYDVVLELEIPKSGLLIEDGDEFVSYPNKRGLVKIIATLALCRRPIRLHGHSFK
ncbi:hypothetical protein PMN64_18265 [Bradyrhizobium sp. UFLA01-814]|uniref:hypothetical protein n=1 Tax=Bradyrhizobium sp. UFLA01-814 TaxID=3023480 RepID=UPI00398BA2A3